MEIDMVSYSNIVLVNNLEISIKISKSPVHTFPGRLKPKAIGPLEMCSVFAFYSIDGNRRNSEWRAKYRLQNDSIFAASRGSLAEGENGIESFGGRLSLSICLFWAILTRACAPGQKETGRADAPKWESYGESYRVTNGDSASEIRYLLFAT